MELRDFLRMMNVRYEDIEKKCGFVKGYLSNRRHRPVNKLPVEDVVAIADALNIEIHKLLDVVKNHNNIVNALFDK